LALATTSIGLSAPTHPCTAQAAQLAMADERRKVDRRNPDSWKAIGAQFFLRAQV